mgnify:CR=1 FL=1
MKKLIKAHRIFVENTPSVVGKVYRIDIYGFEHYKLSLRDKLYYPIAYIKFMWSYFVTH